MAVEVNGKYYRTLADDFTVNGVKVYEAWANGVKYYPEEEDDEFDHDGYRFKALHLDIYVERGYLSLTDDTVYNSPRWLCGPVGYSPDLGKAIYIGLATTNPDRFVNMSLLVTQQNGVLYLLNLDYDNRGGATSGWDTSILVGDVYRRLVTTSGVVNLVHSVKSPSVAILPTSDVPESTSPLGEIESYVDWLLTQDVPRIGRV